MPIIKKGDKSKPENYSGITLINTSYKMLVEIIKNRIDERIEREDKYGHTQMRFRIHGETINAIYTLRENIEENINKIQTKVYIPFVDLKGAFDRINRKAIWEKMEAIGMEEELIDFTKALTSTKDESARENRKHAGE